MVVEVGYVVVGIWLMCIEMVNCMVVFGINVFVNLVVFVCWKKDIMVEVIICVEFICVLKCELFLVIVEL